MRIAPWPAILALLLAVSSGAARSQAPAQPRAAITSPRWAIELKGGDFEPDLDSFEVFYGDDRTGYWAGAFTYAFTHWLEAGAELGFMSEDGVGVLTGQGVPGGAVRYRLFPMHAFVNLRGQFRPQQLFVPYLGVGFSGAYYEERIEQQPERTGVSDVGSNVRVGAQLYLNRLDGDLQGEYGFGSVKQTYLFLEWQRFSTKQSGAELGGDTLLLGIRFSFGRDAGRGSARSAFDP